MPIYFLHWGYCRTLFIILISTTNALNFCVDQSGVDRCRIKVQHPVIIRAAHPKWWGFFSFQQKISAAPKIPLEDKWGFTHSLPETNNMAQALSLKKGSQLWKGKKTEMNSGATCTEPHLLLWLPKHLCNCLILRTYT